MRAEFQSVYGPVRRPSLREARPRVESPPRRRPFPAKPAKAGGGGPEFSAIIDGVKGMAFMEAAVESSKANGKWVKPAKV